MLCTTQIQLQHATAQDEARRITKRLVNHWKHKFETEQSDRMSLIMMPDARIVLTPLATGLAVQIETEREDYQVLEQVVLDHINRMAQQQFQVEWQHDLH